MREPVTANPHPITRADTAPNRTGTWRAFRPVYVQLTSPCREACPAGVEVARATHLIRDGQFREAWETVVDDNPFPATLGRICHRPCEQGCNRAHHDQAVNIGGLEQFLGEKALTEGWALPGPGEARPEQVAVLGGGLAGLSCAYQLRRLGYRVTLFEARESLEDSPEIQRILTLGIDLRCGARAGVDITWDELRSRYAAVLLAIGAPALPGDDEDFLLSLPEEAQLDQRWNLAADSFTGATNMAGVYAAGDVTGTRTAVEAVGAGKRAAAAIDAYIKADGRSLEGARLGHSDNLAMRAYTNPESYPDHLTVNLKRVVSYGEIEPLYFPTAGRREGALTESEALAEAQRCFNCGTCVSCENCMLFCPDMAITRREGGVGFAVDWDHCKGCGACVAECPREALTLVEEVK